MKVTVRHNKTEISCDLPDTIHRHPVGGYAPTDLKAQEDYMSQFNRLVSLIKTMSDEVIKINTPR